MRPISSCSAEPMARLASTRWHRRSLRRSAGRSEHRRQLMERLPAGWRHSTLAAWKRIMAMRFKGEQMILAAALAGLAACAPVDPGLGEALRYDMAIQTVNPDPVYPEGGA